MELSHLTTFVAIAREGHMTRASQALHLTQPALSAQLSKLEEELGQSLFDRTPKGMELTEAGRVFLAHVEPTLSRLAEGRRALAELAGLERGTLAIGGGATATNYLLPHLVARFHDAHPRIQFFVREQASQGVIDAVMDGELDVGVVTTMPTRAGVRPSVPAPLEVRKWAEDELMLVVPTKSRLYGKQKFGWRDLAGEPLVLFEAGSAVRALIDSRFEAEGIKPEIVMELRSIEAIKQMVAEGIGAAFVSRYALASPRDGLRAAKGPIRRQLSVVWRTDRTLGSASRAFLEMMLSHDAPVHD